MADDPRAQLIFDALRFAEWAAGEGLSPVDPGVKGPEDFLMDYSTATGDEDWETLAERIRADAAGLQAQNERMHEALTDIAVYGCGMLNQPIAMNGPEEVWLRKRIAEYERRAYAALAPAQPGDSGERG